MTAKVIPFPILIRVPAVCSIHELVNSICEQVEAMSPELQKEFQRRFRAAPEPPEAPR